MQHTGYKFADKPFLDIVIEEKEPEMVSNKSLADDVLDINLMVAIKYTCPEIYAKLFKVASTLLKKYMRNAAIYVLRVELDKKCRDINTFILNKKGTAAESTESI